MGHMRGLGEINGAQLSIDPSSGLIVWNVSGLPGVDVARVDVRGAGESDWKPYAMCGIGPDGTCGGREYVNWLGPDSAFDFRLVALRSDDPGYAAQVLYRQIRPGLPVYVADPGPVTVTSSGSGYVAPPAAAASGDLLPGVPNLYLGIGAAALLLLLRRKR